MTIICDIELITDYLCISLPNSRFLYMQMHLFLNSHSFLLPVLNQITCQIFGTNIISMLSNREHSQYSVSRTLCHVSICLVYEDYIFDDFPLKYVLRNKTTDYIYEKSCLLVLILKKIVDVYDKFHVLVMAIQYTPDYLRIFFICLNVVHGSFTNIYTIDCFINCLKNELERSAHFVE